MKTVPRRLCSASLTISLALSSSLILFMSLPCLRRIFSFSFASLTSTSALTARLAAILARSSASFSCFSSSVRGLICRHQPTRTCQYHETGEERRSGKNHRESGVWKLKPQRTMYTYYVRSNTHVNDVPLRCFPRIDRDRSFQRGNSPRRYFERSCCKSNI